MVTVYWPLLPAMKVADALLAIAKSKLVASGTVPELAGPLLPVLPAFSLGLLTLAVLAASGLVAFAEIVTSSNSVMLPPEGIEFGLVQETFGTVPEQDQPPLEPALTAYAVTFAGNVSVTVLVPVELDGPALLMVMLYWPLPPLVNVPTGVLVIVRSKTELSGVTGVVIGPLSEVHVGHSFGLLTVTELPGNGFGAVGLIVTSKISMLVPPAAITFGLVQVMFGIVPEQVHVAVEPALTV